MSVHSKDSNIILTLNQNPNNNDKEIEKKDSISKLTINENSSLVSSLSEDIESKMERFIILRNKEIDNKNKTRKKSDQILKKESEKISDSKENDEEEKILDINDDSKRRRSNQEVTLRFLKTKIAPCTKRKMNKDEEPDKNNEENTEEKNPENIDDFDDDNDYNYNNEGVERDTQLLEYDKFYKELFFKNEVFNFDPKFKDKEEEEIKKEIDKLKLKNEIKETTKIREVAVLKGKDTSELDKHLTKIKEQYENLKKVKENPVELIMNNTEGLLYKGTLLNNYFTDRGTKIMPKYTVENERDVKGREIIDFKEVDKDELIRRFWDPCPCLKQRKKIFKWLTYSKFYAGFIVNNFIFDWISLAVIILNTIFILISDPRDDNSLSNTSDSYFLFFYTLECILKILGFGFIFTENAYLKDYWNILDFIVILVGWVSFVLEYITESTKISGLAALRAFRILRPLKTVKSIKGLRRLIIALLASLAKLKDIGIVLTFFFLLFAIAGVQMWQGNFKRRCMSVNYGYMYSLTSSTGMCTFDSDCTQYDEPGNTFICAKGWKNPNNGIVSFDNTLLGFVTVFIIATLEGWTQIFTYVSLTFKDKFYLNPIINFFYFHFYVIAGAFYLINLFLAVTNSEFNNIDRIKQELISKKSLYKLMKSAYDLKEKEKEEKKKKEKELQAKAHKKLGEDKYILKEKIQEDAFYIQRNIKDIPLTYTTIKDIYILQGNSPQELYNIDKAIDKEDDYLYDDVDRQMDEVDRLVGEENNLLKEEEEDEGSSILDRVDKNAKDKLFQDINCDEETVYMVAVEIAIKTTIKFMKEEIVRMAKTIGIKQRTESADLLKQKIEKKEMEKFNINQVSIKEDLSFERELKEQEEENENDKKNDKRIDPTRKKSSKKKLLGTSRSKNNHFQDEKMQPKINEELSFMNDLSYSSDDDDDEEENNSRMAGISAINKGTLGRIITQKDMKKRVTNHLNKNMLNKLESIKSRSNDINEISDTSFDLNKSSLSINNANDKNDLSNNSIISTKKKMLNDNYKIENSINFYKPNAGMTELNTVHRQDKIKKKLDSMRKNFDLKTYLNKARESGKPVNSLGRRRSFLKFLQNTLDQENKEYLYNGLSTQRSKDVSISNNINKMVQKINTYNELFYFDNNNDKDNFFNVDKYKEDNSFQSNHSGFSQLTNETLSSRVNNQVYDEEINMDEMNKKFKLNKVTNFAKKIFLDKNSKNSAANMNTNKMKKFYEKVNKNMNENIIIDMKEPRGRAANKQNVSHIYLGKEYDFNNQDPDLSSFSRTNSKSFHSKNNGNSEKMQKKSARENNNQIRNCHIRMPETSNNTNNNNLKNVKASKAKRKILKNLNMVTLPNENKKDKNSSKNVNENLQKEDLTVGVFKTKSVEKNYLKFPKEDTLKDMVNEENKKMSNTLDPKQEKISENWRARRFYMNYLYNIKEKDLKVKDNFKIDHWRGEIMGIDENVIERKKLPESTEAEIVFNDKSLNIKKYKFLNYKPFEWEDSECAYITNDLKNLPFNCLEIMPIRMRDFGKYYVGKEIHLGVLNFSGQSNGNSSSQIINGSSKMNYSASASNNKTRSTFCAASSFGAGKKIKEDFKIKKLFYDKLYNNIETFNYNTLAHYFLEDEKLFFKMTDEKHREERRKEDEKNIKSKESAIEVKTEVRNVKIFDIQTNTGRYIQWSGSDVLYDKNFEDEENVNKYNDMIASLENFRVIIWLRAPGVKQVQKTKYGLYLISTNTYFDLFIMGLVLANAVVMALDGNLFTPEKYSDISISNYVFNGIFIAEFLIKLFGLGPIIYFSDAFTYLDLIIIAFALVDMISPSDSSSDTIGSNKKLTSQLSFLRVFRIFRVLRLTKILRRMKSMRLILVSIKKSLADVAYIVLILIMFTIIFQLLGMSIMNGNIRYQSFMIAFYTTFQILTTENWNIVFYELYAMNKFTFFYYAIWIFLGNYILFNLFISILLQSFSEDNGDQEDDDDLDEGEKIEKMFGLPDYLYKLKQIESEANSRGSGAKIKKNGMNMNEKLNKSVKENNEGMNSQSGMSDESEDSSVNSDIEEEGKDEEVEVGKGEQGVEKNMKKWKKIDELFKRNECESALYFLSQVNVVRIWCMKTTTSGIFEAIILVIILLSTVRLIVDTIVSGYTSVLIFDMVDLIFNVFFLGEMVLKILALGLILDEGSYLRDNWNKIDFVIVVVSLIDVKSLVDKYISGNSNASSSLNFLKVLRLLRTLRTLRIISHNVQLKLIITSLFDSILPICNALIMVVVVFFMFSIVGINLFYSSFHNCYVPGKDTTFKTADSSFSDYLFQYSIAGTMPAIEGFCKERYNGIMDTGPKFKFSNILVSLVTSYVLGNMEGWPDIMNDYRVYNEYYGIFFLVYLLIVSYFFLNIFTGIMFRYFNEAWSREQKINDKDKKACKYYDFLNQIEDADPEYAIYLSPEPGTLKWFLVCVANSSFLDNFIMLVIFLNMIVMAINFDDCTDWYQTLLDTLNLIFTSIFIAECVLKLCALGISTYFYMGWNQFDFFVVVASIADLIVANIDGITASFLKSFQIIRVLRVLRITRVLRLVKSLKSLEKLIQTLKWSISALANVFILMFILFCIFAILGCYLYEGIQYDEYKDDFYYLNEYYNFDNFYTSFMLVFKCCTGEDWPSIMLEIAFIDVDVVSSAQAYAFMILVNFLSAIIMLNLFLMVTLQQYDEFTSKSYNPVELFEGIMENFKVVWNRYSNNSDKGLRIKKILITSFFLDFKWKKLNFPEKNKLEAIKKYVSELKLRSDPENYVYFHDVLFKIIALQMGSKIDRTDMANALIIKTEKKVAEHIKKKISKYIMEHEINKSKSKNPLNTFNPLTSHLYFKISFLFLKTFIVSYIENTEILKVEESSEYESSHTGSKGLIACEGYLLEDGSKIKISDDNNIKIIDNNANGTEHKTTERKINLNENGDDKKE